MDQELSEGQPDEDDRRSETSDVIKILKAKGGIKLMHRMVWV